MQRYDTVEGVERGAGKWKQNPIKIFTKTCTTEAIAACDASQDIEQYLRVVKKATVSLQVPAGAGGGL